MEQNINDLEPGMIMLVVKNDNGIFSPLQMSKTQGHFLHGCIATMSNDEPLVLENSVELFVKCLDDEKKRDNSDWDDKQ